MIPFNFVYCLPQTLAEAIAAYQRYHNDNRPALYYGGGSEIITMSRAQSIFPGAVIDLKQIPECLALEKTKDTLIIGAANSLRQIKDSSLFPMLGQACGRVADHTNQCRITLGGNLSGTIRYRETSLPLLLCDATALLCGPDGLHRKPFCEAFKGRMHYLPGEFLMQVHIPAFMLELPFAHIKKTASDKIDYPLVNVTGMLANGRLRIALTGICPAPIRSPELEEVLNDTSLSSSARVEAALERLPKAAADSEAGSPYRQFVFRTTLQNLLTAWEDGTLEKNHANI